LRQANALAVKVGAAVLGAEGRRRGRNIRDRHLRQEYKGQALNTY